MLSRSAARAQATGTPLAAADAATSSAGRVFPIPPHPCIAPGGRRPPGHLVHPHQATIKPKAIGGLMVNSIVGGPHDRRHGYFGAVTPGVAAPPGQH